MGKELELRDDNFDGWISRAIGLNERSAQTIDKNNRSVESVISTEDPVTVIDWARYEYIDEILLNDGVVIPQNRQVPLLDNHSRYNTSSIKGSARDIKMESGQISARLYFASRAEDEWSLAEEGHLTDVSVGYRVFPEESVFIEAGETAIVNGKTFKNSGTRTIAVRKKWELKEVSLTPIGADSRAKFRSETVNNEHKTLERKADMPEEIKPVATQEPERKETVDLAKIQKEAEEKAVKAANERTAGIMDAGRGLGFTVEEIRGFIDSEKSLADVQREMIIAHAKKGERMDTTVLVGADETDKFRSVVTDGLALRCSLNVEKPVDGSNEFRGVSLVDIARECVEKETGKRLRDKEEIVRSAITGTGSFPLILSNVAHKAMSQAYNAFMPTFQQWTRKGSLSDFKAETRLRLSEADELVQMTEHGEFKHSEVTEQGQTIQLGTFGRMFDITRKAIINDDLGALSTIPAKYGAAARRLINRLVYAKLKDNVNTYDSVALFDNAHGNIGTQAALSVNSLSEARAKMRQQKNIGGKESLNIAPAFLLVPTLIETIAEQLISSPVDPAKTNATPNPFANRLSVICDPELDDGANKPWYLAAAPGMVDTIEVSYLNGDEMPKMEMQQSFEMLGIRYRIYLDFGIAVLDWRGLFKNAGA